MAWFYMLPRKHETHIEVITQLDLLIPKTTPDSMLKRALTEFRNGYFGKCDQIFLKFSQLVKPSDVNWIMMKKPEHSEVILNELTAMLSECVHGLLRMGK